MSKEIVFKSLFYKNFMSVGENGIRLQLDRHPTTLVYGHNGAGKSVILEALTFGLFNKSYRGITKPGLVNSVNQKECLVEVEFTKGPDRYKIIRSISPNRFIIEKNGQTLDSEAANKDSQKYLETTILGADFKTFSQLVIVGAASYTPFMKLTAAQRREMVESVLDIGIFSNMNKILKSKLSAWREESARIESGIESTEREISLLKDFIRKSETSAEDQVASVKKELRSVIDEAKLIKDTMDEKKDPSPIKEKLAKAKDYRIKFERGVSKLDANKSTIEKNIYFFENNDTCPTCDQEIDPDHKSIKIDTFSKEVEDIESEKSNLSSRLSKTVNLLSSLDSEISDIEKHNRGVDIQKSRLDNVKTRAKQLKSKLDNMSSEEEDTSEEKEKLSKAQGKLEHLKSEEKRLKELKWKYDRALKLLKDDGIKSRIIKKYIPVLNTYVNKYLRILNFNVTFELDEKFNESLKTRYKNEFKYSNFSMGERQRLDLALMFAWLQVARSKNSLSTNLLILDEVEGHLDKAGADDVLGISEHLGEDMNVFIISHKQEIEDRVRSVVRFEKQGGFTKLS